MICNVVAEPQGIVTTQWLLCPVRYPVLKFKSSTNDQDEQENLVRIFPSRSFSVWECIFTNVCLPPRGRKATHFSMRQESERVAPLTFSQEINRQLDTENGTHRSPTHPNREGWEGCLEGRMLKKGVEPLFAGRERTLVPSTLWFVFDG
jgi:hypothetical protein